MEITGEVVDIRYKNEVNSYTIADIETEEELITVVGYLPFIRKSKLWISLKEIES